MIIWMSLENKLKYKPKNFVEIIRELIMRQLESDIILKKF